MLQHLLRTVKGFLLHCGGWLVLVCFFFNLRLTASKEQEKEEQLHLCSSSGGTRTVLTTDWLRMDKNLSDSSSRGGPAACPGERMITEERNTQTNSFIFTASLGHAREPAQLEERWCSRILLLGDELPEQRAGARSLVFRSCKCRRWNLL